MTDTVPPVVVVTAGSVVDLSAAGKNDAHASRLKEVLILRLVNSFVKMRKKIT